MFLRAFVLLLLVLLLLPALPALLVLLALLFFLVFMFLLLRARAPVCVPTLFPVRLFFFRILFLSFLLLPLLLFLLTNHYNNTCKADNRVRRDDGPALLVPHFSCSRPCGCAAWSSCSPCPSCSSCISRRLCSSCSSCFFSFERGRLSVLLLFPGSSFPSSSNLSYPKSQSMRLSHHLCVI